MNWRSRIEKEALIFEEGSAPAVNVINYQNTYRTKTLADSASSTNTNLTDPNENTNFVN